MPDVRHHLPNGRAGMSAMLIARGNMERGMIVVDVSDGMPVVGCRL